MANSECVFEHKWSDHLPKIAQKMFNVMGKNVVAEKETLLTQLRADLTEARAELDHEKKHKLVAVHHSLDVRSHRCWRRSAQMAVRG